MVITYSACSRNVFADIRSWNDDLGLADVVVFKEHHLQKITDFLILVDNSPNSIHKVNDLLGL